jgi:hypothetical protein
MTNTLSIMLKPIFGGWIVSRTDGRELARFHGPGARLRALRFVNAQLIPRPNAPGR